MWHKFSTTFNAVQLMNSCNSEDKRYLAMTGVDPSEMIYYIKLTLIGTNFHSLVSNQKCIDGVSVNICVIKSDSGLSDTLSFP